jgi:hypothetical protein
MLTVMTHDADVPDLHDRLWPVFNSEVPVTTDAHGLVGRGDACAAWVDAVYLFSSFVVVRTCLIFRPDRYASSGRSSVSLDRAGFDDDGPSEVATTIDLDGRSLSTSDGTLHVGGASSTSSGRSTVTWWLPAIPTSRLEVAVEWARGGLQGRVEFDTSEWRSAANAVLSI